MNIEPVLLRDRQVATMLGICTRGVWRLVAGGQLPRPVKVGRSARWRVVDVRTYIDRISQEVAR